MTESAMPETRGYLLHLSHYDPHWVRHKAEEQPFDGETGLEIAAALDRAGFNLLAIDCADAVEYESHPELSRHYTIPMKTLETLATAARERGIQVVPKLNFSRSYWHRHNDWMLGPDERWHDHFDDNEYWRKGFELIDELIAVCRPDRFFHVGMDEDHDRTHTQYVAAIERLHSGLKERNLRTIIWNDTAVSTPHGLVHNEKSLAAETEIPKDIVHVLWDYDSVPGDAVRRIRQRDLELWVAPGAGDPMQTRAFRDVALQHGATGMFMTTWSPCNQSTRKRLLEGIERMGGIYRGET